MRYKARLVAQGFSQRHRIDYEETYSPVMDATIFRFLIYLVVSEGFDMRLMNVVTTYLYVCIYVYENPLRIQITLSNEFKTTKHVFNQVTTIFIWFKTVWSNVV